MSCTLYLPSGRVGKIVYSEYKSASDLKKAMNANFGGVDPVKHGDRLQYGPAPVAGQRGTEIKATVTFDDGAQRWAATANADNTDATVLETLKKISMQPLKKVHASAVP